MGEGEGRGTVVAAYSPRAFDRPARSLAVARIIALGRMPWRQLIDTSSSLLGRGVGLSQARRQFASIAGQGGVGLAILEIALGIAVVMMSATRRPLRLPCQVWEGGEAFVPRQSPSSQELCTQRLLGSRRAVRVTLF